MEPTRKKDLMRTPSFQEASDLLKVHLQKKHRLKRKSPVPPVPLTKKDVREEAARILEQFLEKELARTNSYRGKPLIGTAYQKVKDEDITEEEYYLENSNRSRKSPAVSPESFSDQNGHHSCGASSNFGHTSVIHSRGPSELSQTSVNSAKTSSVIHSRETSELSRTSVNSAKNSIHSLLDDNEDIPFADGNEVDTRAKSLPPDLSPAHRIDSTIKSSQSLSPSKLENLNQNKEKRVKKPDSLHLQSLEKTRHSHPINGDGSPVTRGRRRYRSGSISSSDTENSTDIVSPDRKKKSVFKRARERLNSVLNRSKDRKQLEGGDESLSKKDKNGKAVVNNKGDRSEVLKERHTHKHGHVEQHHFQDGDRTGVLRTEEVWESTDITDKQGAKHKHIDKHSKVKESTDLSTSEGGIFSNLRRLTAKRGKKAKKKVPESKSADFSLLKRKGKRKYQRNISVPDGGRFGRDGDVVESRVFETDGRRTQHTTEVTTLDDVGLNAIGQLDIGQRSEPMDISESSQGMHPNKSFALDFDIEETEFRRRLPTGEIDTEIDRNIHQHAVTPDLEVDGDTPPVIPEAAAGSPKKESSPTQEEKEKLYGIIAERLAEIGDSYVSEAGGTSPRRPTGAAAAPVEAHGSYDVRDGDGLNSLERELRDSLRSFGDNFSVHHPVSEEATEAAKDIVKQATYNTFTDTVKRAIGDDVGWDQLAMLFYVTKKTVKAAGVGGAVAMKVKEMSLRYLEDKFAGWIVDQGGWDSVLESGSTDSELD